MPFPGKSFPSAKPVDFLSKSPAPAAPEMEAEDIGSEVAELIAKYGVDAVRQAVEDAAANTTDTEVDADIADAGKME